MNDCNRFIYIPEPNTLRAQRMKRYASTISFLNQHGQGINALDEIQAFGDLIAVVDPFGGFWAYITNGVYKSGKNTPITIRFQDFQTRGILRSGNLTSIRFTQPEKIYLGIPDSAENTLKLSDAYFVNSDRKAFVLNNNRLDIGVYRIISPDLIDTIRDAFEELGPPDIPSRLPDF
ncbi:MAG: hypothetical protein ABIA21_03045 [Candidatus Aenigmatarchaeota archaeon]